MNNLDNIGVDELDYDIQNHIKIYWFDTDAYEFNKDNNNGYIYGIVSWVGQYDLDIVTDYYNSDGSDISWEWFKTEQERDQAFKENEKMSKAEMIKEIQGCIEISKNKDHLSAYWLADKIDLIIGKILKENEDE